MRWRIPIVALLALFVTVSCDQQLVEPTADQAVAEAPAFNWMNNPDNGNFKVWRDAYGLRMCWSDPDSGLRVCHATYPLGTPEPDCDLQQVEAPLSYQDVGWLDIAADWCDYDLKAHQQGAVWITIRDPNTAGECVGAALVAEGWGKIRINDNDVCGVEPDDPSVNVWSFRAQGKITAVGGERVVYNGLAHYSWSHAAGWKENVFVNLH
jgi:hypothetical protein